MTKPKYLVLDIETTGLDPRKDGILEIGAIAIDDQYRNIGAYSAIVRPSQAHYDRLLANDYVREMHTKNGLLESLPHGLDLSHVDANLYDWLRQTFDFGPSEIVLAGHTISFDHGFIKAQMALVGGLLSHRTLDFSAITRLLREVGYDIPNEEMPHRGLPDAIIELKEFSSMMALLATDREDAKNYRELAECQDRVSLSRARIQLLTS